MEIKIGLSYHLLSFPENILKDLKSRPFIFMLEEIIRCGIPLRRIRHPVEQAVVMPEFVTDITSDDFDIAVADTVNTTQWLTPLVLLVRLVLLVLLVRIILFFRCSFKIGKKIIDLYPYRVGTLLYF